MRTIISTVRSIKEALGSIGITLLLGEVGKEVGHYLQGHKTEAGGIELRVVLEVVLELLDFHFVYSYTIRIF